MSLILRWHGATGDISKWLVSFPHALASKEIKRAETPMKAEEVFWGAAGEPHRLSLVAVIT